MAVHYKMFSSACSLCYWVSIMPNVYIMTIKHASGHCKKFPDA